MHHYCIIQNRPSAPEFSHVIISSPISCHNLHINHTLKMSILPRVDRDYMLFLGLCLNYFWVEKISIDVNPYFYPLYFGPNQSGRPKFKTHYTRGWTKAYFRKRPKLHPGKWSRRTQSVSPIFDMIEKNHTGNIQTGTYIRLYGWFGLISIRRSV